MLVWGERERESADPIKAAVETTAAWTQNKLELIYFFNPRPISPLVLKHQLSVNVGRTSAGLKDQLHSGGGGEGTQTGERQRRPGCDTFIIILILTCSHLLYPTVEKTQVTVGPSWKRPPPRR